MLGSRLQRLASLSAAVLVGLGALAACGGGDDEEADKDENEEQSDNAPMERGDDGGNDVAPTTAPPAPGGAQSYIATATGAEVAVYPAPDAAEPIETFDNPYKPETAMVFLVEGTDVSGEWLPVYVPVKPNGSKGFVRAADVSVTPNPYWVRIEQEAHRIVVTKGDEVIVDDQVGLGEAQKSTPNGVYFIRELIENIGDPVYGPYAYGLSAFTENPDVAERFGGVGQVGLHGTNDPSSIGKNVSNGCIRVNNDIITQLAGILPLGTPVEIVA